jgi:hypothetical protein
VSDGCGDLQAAGWVGFVWCVRRLVSDGCGDLQAVGLQAT